LQITQTLSGHLDTSGSEELFHFTEEEYDEVMTAPVEDEWTGYSEWSEALEQSAFDADLERRATVMTPNGAILLKRECSHSDCEFSRCKRSIRIEGVEI
jgi:hypothetical protein